MPAGEGTRRVPWSLGAAAVMLGCYVPAAGIAAVLPGLRGAGRIVAAGVLAATMAGIAAWLAAPRLAGPPPPRLPDPPRRALPPETERLARRLGLERQLDRALGRTRTEEEVYALAGQALGTLSPDVPSELLVAGPRRRQLLQVAEAGPDGEGPGCPVDRPERCEAIRLDRTLRWGSSEDLDACPFLAHRDRTACSAVCVPLRVAGNAAGVVHRTASVAEPATDFDVDALESIARRVEAHLTVMRLDAIRLDVTRPDVASPADDLDGATGLGRLPGRDEHRIAPRVEIEQIVTTLLHASRSFTVARCDITDLAGYRDRHGDARTAVAVRCFEQTTLSCVRPGDAVGRIGARELLLVFPDAAIGDVRRVLDRIREALILAFAERELAPLAPALGAVQAHGAARLDELLDAVDAAVRAPGPRPEGPGRPG